jgi:hypothetical protein
LKAFIDLRSQLQGLLTLPQCLHGWAATCDGFSELGNPAWSSAQSSPRLFEYIKYHLLILYIYIILISHYITSKSGHGETFDKHEQKPTGDKLNNPRKQESKNNRDVSSTLRGNPLLLRCSSYLLAVTACRIGSLLKCLPAEGKNLLVTYCKNLPFLKCHDGKLSLKVV